MLGIFKDLFCVLCIFLLQAAVYTDLWVLYSARHWHATGTRWWGVADADVLFMRRTFSTGLLHLSYCVGLQVAYVC